MTDDIAAGWQSYIARKIERSEQRTLKLVMETVGEVLAEERKKMTAEFETRLAREVAALRTEFLQDRLDAERGKRTFPRPVPPS